MIRWRLLPAYTSEPRAPLGRIATGRLVAAGPGLLLAVAHRRHH